MLNQARREAKLTQQQLADLVDVHKSYISKMENGRVAYPPKLDVIKDIAIAVQADPALLAYSLGRITEKDTRLVMELAKRYGVGLTGMLEGLLGEMGNHSVGKAFRATLEVFGEAELLGKAPNELLKILDSVGFQFEGTDAEFDCYDDETELLGKVLIKIWGAHLPPFPSEGEDLQDEWSDNYYDLVITPFRHRYCFW